MVPGPVPFKPTKRPEFVDIWTATYGTFAKDKNNQIYVFGLNNYNQLGWSLSSLTVYPVFISLMMLITCVPFYLGLKEQRTHFHPSVSGPMSMHDWVQISGGQHHTLALDNNGEE